MKIKLNDSYDIELINDKIVLYYTCYNDYTTYVMDDERSVKYFLNKHFKPDNELFKMLHTRKIVESEY